MSLVLHYFPAHGFHEYLHVLRPVVNLMVDLAVRQQSPVTVGLQRPFTDPQFLAHVRPVHPVHLFGRAVAGAKLPHVLRKAVEPFLHLLEGLFSMLTISIVPIRFYCYTSLQIYRSVYVRVSKTVPLVLVLLHVCSLVTFRAVKSREKLYISARPSAYFPPFPLAGAGHFAYCNRPNIITMDEAVFIAQYTFLATPAVIEEEEPHLGQDRTPSGVSRAASRPTFSSSSSPSPPVASGRFRRTGTVPCWFPFRHPHGRSTAPGTRHSAASSRRTWGLPTGTGR